MEQVNPSQTANIPPNNQPLQPKKSIKKKILLISGIFLLAIVLILMYWILRPAKSVAPAANSATEKQVDTEGLRLDPAKNYGDKYANGILPVGDNNYSTKSAEKGKVYLCNANFVPSNQAGAQTRGPWFIGTTQWDINKKYAVRGSVSWQQQITNTVNGTIRNITTNNLPDHATGTYPVQSSDPAYQYDRNPNSIKSQALTYSLNGTPTYGSPQCIGGEVGVMLTGVSLFNAFDAGGRDAGAWEIQDACEGHPQSSGQYHYHTLSSCIKDVGVSTVIGFALDGYPITGPKVGDKNYLTTSDLDECHGIVSEVILDGKKTTTYHYVMTQDFPYSVSCFRSKASEAPGKHTAGEQGQAGGQQPPTGMRPPRR
jgi:hypothetical protein